MIYRTLADVIDTAAHMKGEGIESRRILLAPDGLGYSFHDTLVVQGAELHLHYKNHIETNYCIAGEGEVEDVETGQVHALFPGAIYVLDKHDRHIVRATKSDLRFVCIFTPALTGHESHDKDGSYEPSAQE